MGIQRVESVVYGVDDLDRCVRFFEDLGLSLVTRRDAGAVLETRIKQTVRLEPAPEATIREVVWGVDTPAELATLVGRVAADREVVESGGIHHTRDETGFGLGLTLAAPAEFEPDPPRPANTSGHVTRWNAALTSVGRVRPLRICHVALNIPQRGREAAVAFYVDRLGFIPTDIVQPMGTFMRCEGDADQHNFLLCHRPDRAGINHVSFEVAGFDDVIEGGNHMIGQGWREARRLGRHTVGSNVFRFLHAPCGGRVELAADMDRVDDSYGTRVHETAPPHHIWTLRGSKEDNHDR